METSDLHEPKRTNQENKNFNSLSQIENDIESSHVITTVQYKKNEDFNQSPANYSTKYSIQNNSTLYLDPSLLSTVTDESFERIEKMCNKSMSDPESTLYMYMKSTYENKEKSNEDEESEALERLLNEFHIEEVEEEQVLDEDIIKTSNTEYRTQFKILQDQTQIDNIEPPTCLWEDTVTEVSKIDTICQISPTKMIGLIRPSTIFEESTLSENSNSSFSFRTATKTNSSLEEYVSAHELNKEEQIEKNSTISIEKQNEVHSHNTTNYININNSKESTNSKHSDNFISNKEYQFDEDNSNDIIQTISSDNNLNSSLPSNCSTLNDISSFTEDSLYNSQFFKHNTNINEIEFDSLNISKNNSNNLIDFDNSSSSTKLLGVSREFNDTIEEMEYIMQQGIKYMTEKGAIPKQTQQNKSNQLQQLKTQQQQQQQQQPQQNCTQLLTPFYTFTISNPKPKLSTIEKKTPTIGIFKKTTPCCKIPTGKPTTLKKKSTAFNHIISPVAAYIKSTPQTVLQTIAKPSKETNKSKTIKKELDFKNSNLIVQNNENNKNYFNICDNIPRKAYISSDMVKIKDARSPITIPGGEKIHRLLHPSPTVIRHEGRLKHDSIDSPEIQNKLSKQKNLITDSLAELSILSGEISLHTIKDAKKILKH